MDEVKKRDVFRDIVMIAAIVIPLLVANEKRYADTRERLVRLESILLDGISGTVRTNSSDISALRREVDVLRVRVDGFHGRFGNE